MTLGAGDFGSYIGDDTFFGGYFEGGLQ